MSLMRQIAWLVLGVVLAALGGAVGLSTVSTQGLMRTQLQLKNADNAQSLALALSQQKGDAELIKLLVSAQFDTGAYEFVRWRSPKGEVVFERSEAPRPGQAPAWFRAWLPIDVAPGVAQVSSGWNAIGTVELRSHASYAHDALWFGTRRLVAWMLIVGIGAAIAASVGLRRIRRPLDAAVAQAEGVLAGSYGQVTEPRVPELQRLTRAMNAMVHNTAWVSGHFHLIFGGTTIIMYLAMAYYFWPMLVGKPLFSNSMAILQLWLWLIGMVILTTPWHVLGLLGQPRRISTVVYNNLLTLSWKPYELAMIFGGLILLVSAGLFVYNLVKTQLQTTTETIAQTVEYAEPIHPVNSLPEYLNSFGLWNKVIAVLMAISFGWPILQFFFMNTFGSSGWGY